MMYSSNKKHGDDILLTYKFLYNLLFLFYIKAKRPIYEFITICQWDHITESICQCTFSPGFLATPSWRCETPCHLKKEDADYLGVSELPGHYLYV